MSFYFLTEFFKYFFRVLDEDSSLWLKLCWFILGHPVLFTRKRDFFLLCLISLLLFYLIIIIILYCHLLSLTTFFNK
jgi:hypothetical protein